MNHATVSVTDDGFQDAVLNSELPVLVDFWAPWCGPCRIVAPVLEEIAGEYSDRLIVAKVNTDEQQRRAQEYGVRGIPTLLLFQNGHEIDRVVGALPKEELHRWLNATLAN